MIMREFRLYGRHSRNPEDNRVYLRQAKMSDIMDTDLMTPLVELFSDEATAESLGSYTRTAEHHVDWFVNGIHWDEWYCWYIMYEGIVVGWIVLRDIDYDAGWLTIAICPDARGRGFAEDALNQYLDKCFTELGIRKVLLSVYSFNTGAIRLYERVGFRKEAVVTEFVEWHGKLYDRVTYSMNKEEYNALRNP